MLLNCPSVLSAEINAPVKHNGFSGSWESCVSECVRGRGNRVLSATQQGAL